MNWPAAIVVAMLAMFFAVTPMIAFADTWDTVTIGTSGCLQVSVSSGTEALDIRDSTGDEDYDIVSTDDDYPYSFTLKLTNDGCDVSTVSISSDGTGEAVTHITGDYYLVTVPDDDTSVLTVDPDNGSAATFHIEQANGGTASAAGTGIYSYLPAPGQFVNEGVTSGGWGAIYQNSSSNLKTLVDDYSATGVSLGAYGGSITFDFEGDISNDSSNKYGVDLIVYGNAFSGWSEPGCIQVAQAVNGIPADANSDDVVWYDIAGSRHYESATDWESEIIYADPYPDDNANGTSNRYSVPYAYTNNVTYGSGTQTWSTYSTMTTNSWHDHSWFPLARNYFDATERNATGYSSGLGASGPMAYIDNLSFADYLESQEISDSTSDLIVDDDTTTIKYKGVNLYTTSYSTGDYAFGYADTHANGSTSYYGDTSYNPYNSSSSSSGGDPIDISWAVYPGGDNKEGEPVNLANIRFVRISTGTMNITAFGEMSTEITGIYDADDDGSGSSSAPTITIGGYSLSTLYSMDIIDTATLSHMGVITVDRSALDEELNFPESANVSATGGDYNWVNNSKNSPLSVDLSSDSLVRVISQTGTAPPYIVVLKFD